MRFLRSMADESRGLDPQPSPLLEGEGVIKIGRFRYLARVYLDSERSSLGGFM